MVQLFDEGHLFKRCRRSVARVGERLLRNMNARFVSLDGRRRWLGYDVNVTQGMGNVLAVRKSCSERHDYFPIDLPQGHLRRLWRDGHQAQR